MQYLEGNNRFYVPGPEGEDDVAEMTFRREGDDLAIIDHTYVNENYRREGIADHLFDLVVEKMRLEGRKIAPVCPYARKQFDKRKDLQTLLAEGFCK